MRTRLRHEIWLMLGVSLGQSAIYAILQIIQRLAASAPLASQSAELNTSQATQSWLDLLYQLAAVLFLLLPALLALYLLHTNDPVVTGGAREVNRAIGFDASRPLKDSWHGVALAGVIGIPGIALYVAGRSLGITVNVVASDLGAHWWTVPVLLLSAAGNGLLEELVVVAYLCTRLAQLGGRRWNIIVLSALLRGSYHLYQGIGPAIGNVVMGLVFAWVFTRTRRVMPLVVAHFILDAISFVGYAALAPWLHASFPTWF